MKIERALQPSTMEIKRIVEHNHQQCKLNDEHNKTPKHNNGYWNVNKHNNKNQNTNSGASLGS
jgi:hypothetical protein